MEILTKILLALFGIFIGHIITRVLDRGRPLLIIQEISTGTKSNETSECTEEISELTKKSWSTETVQSGNTNWGELETVYKAASFELELLLNVEEKAEKIIKLLDSANSIESMNDAIKEIFKNPGLQSLLEMIILREKITFSSKEYTETTKLNGIFHPDREGCLALVFDDSIGKMGRNLSIDEWRKDKLLPIFSAMQHHDKDIIKKAIESIEQFAREQRDIHSILKNTLTPLRENETIWITKCSIMNYGKTPIVINPSGRLIIEEADGQKLQPIPCYIATKLENKDDATDLMGPRILAPEKELSIWIVTKEKKSKMDNGNKIEGLYKDKNAKAMVEVDIVLPHFSLIKTVKSKKSNFEKN